MNKWGSQPSAISAVISTFFTPSEATKIGMRSRTGWLMIFNGLPRPVPWSGGSGSWNTEPSWVSGPCRAHTLRQISITSRVRASGLV